MSHLTDLTGAGVSIWLDDLSRSRIQSGNLVDLIENKSVVGVTTNPSIFQAAISSGDGYEEQLSKLAADKADAEAAIEALTTDDVRNACDIFAPTFEATNRLDGRVSIEVDPRLAHDTENTVAQAKHLSKLVGKENLLVKIPATKEGLPAITQTIAAGISVNVTLIFSVDRYRAVAEAYLDGLEGAKENGHDLAKLHSVASIFISRIDTEVDKRLEKIGGDALELKGTAGLANSRVAFEAYEEVFSSPRFTALAAEGATVQRPLWASTGVKNPDYSDTMYVDELVTDNVINTMPEKTLDAFIDHGNVTGDTVKPNIAAAHVALDDLARAGIDMDNVCQQLEDEGVDKFEVAWNSLIDTVSEALANE